MWLYAGFLLEWFGLDPFGIHYDSVPYLYFTVHEVLSKSDQPVCNAALAFVGALPVTLLLVGLTG